MIFESARDIDGDAVEVSAITIASTGTLAVTVWFQNDRKEGTAYIGLADAKRLAAALLEWIAAQEAAS